MLCFLSSQFLVLVQILFVKSRNEAVLTSEVCLRTPAFESSLCLPHKRCQIKDDVHLLFTVHVNTLNKYFKNYTLLIKQINELELIIVLNMSSLNLNRQNNGI